MDESFREHVTDGVYVLAAVVYAPAALADVRQLMVRLRGHRKVGKLHWHEMDRVQRKLAAEELAAIDGFWLVAVGAPVPRRRQERARAACLAALVPELHDREVRRLQIEARAPELDLRDVRTVIGARFSLPAGAQLHVEHVRGEAEPALWSADIVAGAVRSHFDGHPAYRGVLAERLHQLIVPTGC